MANAIRAKDLPETSNMKARLNKGRARKAALDDAIDTFKNKKFDDLNTQERDVLLKVIAIHTGIIEE